jgi:hypothetical protein
MHRRFPDRHERGGDPDRPEAEGPDSVDEAVIPRPLLHDPRAGHDHGERCPE